MNGGPTIPAGKQKKTLFAIVALALLYSGVFLYFQRLSFEPARDERFYWPTIQRFAQDFPPPISLLRDYDEPSTPLFFICFGALEHFTHGGIHLARTINLLLSFTIACLVLGGWRASKKSTLACIGLLAFPYYLGTSVYLYPDILSAFWVLIGVWSAREHRNWLAAIFFALGIATRQYMLAFPAAYVAQFALESFRARRFAPRILPYTLSCLTLGGWFLLFGGLAPRSGYEAHLASSPGVWHIDHYLYFLSTIGAYYVLVETALFRTWQGASSKRAFVLASVVIVLFIICPPTGNPAIGAVPSMGYLDKVLRALMPDTARIITLGFLAVLATIRFAKPDVWTCLLYANAAILLRSHTAWDKYALPFLVVLWFIRGRDRCPPSADSPAI